MSRATTCAVGVMARAPSAAGKTRLRPHLSADRLATLRAALLADTLQVVAGLTGIDVVVFVTPGTATDEVAALMPPGFRCAPQAEGDLGERMRAAIADLIGRRYAAAVLVGADIPFLTAAAITEARDALLAGAGVILGPVDDGGYYLIGMTDLHPGLFDRIAWGTGTVLADTLRAAEQLRIETRLVGRTYDIDTIADLHRLERDLAIRSPEIAPNVRRWFGTMKMADG